MVLRVPPRLRGAHVRHRRAAAARTNASRRTSWAVVQALPPRCPGPDAHSGRHTCPDCDMRPVATPPGPDHRQISISLAPGSGCGSARPGLAGFRRGCRGGRRAGRSWWSSRMPPGRRPTRSSRCGRGRGETCTVRWRRAVGSAVEDSSSHPGWAGSWIRSALFPGSGSPAGRVEVHGVKIDVVWEMMREPWRGTSRASSNRSWAPSWTRWCSDAAEMMSPARRQVRPWSVL